MKHVKFIEMKQGDKEDYDFLMQQEHQYTKQTAKRLLRALVELDEGLSGYQISRLGHSLQAATRAYYDGADNDWMVAALLHDIGDIFAPYNHDAHAASIIKPFVREQCTWVVEKHGCFQLLYYAEHVNVNPNERDKYKGHQYFDDCSMFCERWDQTSFDPNYQNLSIEFFRPIVEEIFARDPYDIDVIQPGIRVPLIVESCAQERLIDFG